MKIVGFSVKSNKWQLKRVYSWVMVALYLTVIFLFSHQTGEISNDMSIGISDKLRQHISLPDKMDLSFATIRLNYNYILRKATHFTEYFILAILLYRVLFLYRIKHTKSMIAAYIFCVAYAVSDEFHQIFVRGRSSRIMDIGIDSLGALCALLSIFLWKRIKKWKRRAIYRG